ncbi:MAG: transcription elongation factor GreA [Opitutaceae bacterium]|jgi:transcription elongation factor GreA|nr:transcription elongation factor GreA [Opitutaceae bacterium]
MNKEAISALISKNPALKAAKARLEAMQDGAYCIHRSWGFGQIKSYDEAAQKLLIDFPGKKNHPMDPGFCVKTLEILPENHLLVRNRTEPKKIAALIEDDPAQLVAEGLEAYPNHATSAIDLEITLAQILGPEKFKKWWSAAKKQIAKDPRITTPAKKTELYVLRDTPVSAEDELIEAFTHTRSARRQILVAEKLLSVPGIKNTKSDLNPLLTKLTEQVRGSKQLTPAERLHGAFIRDALADLLGADASALSPTQAELVSNTRDLAGLAEKIPVNFQPEFLELVRSAHPGEYLDCTLALLKVSQGKFTTECINFLIGNEHSEQLAETLKRWLIEQNLRAPVLHWIVKNRHSKKFARLLNDLISPRLLNAVFYAIDYEALQSATTRRIPLAEILSDDTELIPDLLSTADPETARDLANTLMLNQGFEELTKKSLLARFIKLFPNIQSIVASDAESKEEKLLVSRESYDRKRAEYETIVSKKIPENSKAIAAAREHGDLRENSEYKMAKQDQAVLMAQKAQLERDLTRARITEFKDTTAGQVGVGSIVELATKSTGKPVTYTILGAWDSDPERNIIAYKTPLGLALLGKKAGDEASVKIGQSEETYTITKITPYAS